VKSSSNKVDHPLSGSVNGFANGTFLQNIFFWKSEERKTFGKTEISNSTLREENAWRIKIHFVTLHFNVHFFRRCSGLFHLFSVCLLNEFQIPATDRIKNVLWVWGKRNPVKNDLINMAFLPGNQYTRLNSENKIIKFFPKISKMWKGIFWNSLNPSVIPLWFLRQWFPTFKRFFFQVYF